MILDADSPSNEVLTEEQHGLVESAAEMLYGLIHVRYILTSRGMSAMYEKYKNSEFGRCPRVLCNGQPALPVGLADNPRQNTVKIFCPKCGDIYYPRYKYQVGQRDPGVQSVPASNTCQREHLCAGAEQCTSIVLVQLAIMLASRVHHARCASWILDMRSLLLQGQFSSSECS